MRERERERERESGGRKEGRKEESHMLKNYVKGEWSSSSL
jgi:hypothetical protein